MTSLPTIDADAPLPADLRARWGADGVLIVRDFLSAEQCAVLRQRAAALRTRCQSDAPPVAFETRTQAHADSDHFAGSGGDIRVFVEEDDPTRANKLGHALHDLDPVFGAASRDPRLAALCAALGVQAPRLVQSMYIFKPPRAGGAVAAHQDATFLRTDPPSVVGFWIALHDADVENGCLWALPGRHRAAAAPRARFGYDSGALELVADDPRPWPVEEAVPLEVAAGTLVVLHGLLPHLSAANRSARPREAYALHVVDGTARWAAENWLRRAAPFRGF